MRLWGKAEERGVILGAIASIIFFVFIHPDPDVDLAIKYPGNPPYGVLWFFLNPLYAEKQLYPIVVFIVWAVTTLIQWDLVRQKILHRNVLLLQIMSVMFLFMIHAEQDVSVILFAPFATLVPWVVVVEFIQKIPFPGTDQWTCAFNGNGLATNVYQNPCLTTGTKFFIFSSHIYSLSYILLVFWAVYPLLIYRKSRVSGVVVSGRGVQNRVYSIIKRFLKIWGIVLYYMTLKYPWEILKHIWGLWKGEGVEAKEYSLTPAIRTQPSAPLSTEYCGCCHAFWDEVGHYLDGPNGYGSFKIVETKNNKGHEFRFMVVSKSHTSHIDYEPEAVAELWKFMKSFKRDFVILQPDFASIKDHWHVVASTLDSGTDDEQIAKTRRLECRFK